MLGKKGLPMFVLSVVTQVILYWSIFYQISKIKIKPLFVVISVAYFLATTYFLDAFSIFDIIPFFGMYAYCMEGVKQKSLAYFYAIYTAFASVLLTNFSDAILYEFGMGNFYDKHFMLMDSVTSLVPIFIHYVILKISRIDFDQVDTNCPFIKKNLLLPVNIILSIFYLLIIFLSYYEIILRKSSTASEYTKYILFLEIFGFFAILAFIGNRIKDYWRMQIDETRETQYHNLNLYINEVEGMYQTIRGFKHDYSNMLISLKQSVDSGDICQVQETYEEILNSANLKLTGRTINIAELANVGDPAVKSILFWKLTEARQKHIEVSIEIKKYIEKIDMDILDFVRLTSIILDNAIEEAVTTVNPKLNFALIEEEHEIVMVVQNSWNVKNIAISRIFEEGYSSKGEGRGTGLFNVRQIINLYDNTSIDTEIDNHYFTQIISIGDEI
ncbi:sensor histidine kinase [Floricoccus penangensis]|nr:GHKL domain-containing protein [Floricoccus penangensis]